MGRSIARLHKTCLRGQEVDQVLHCYCQYSVRPKMALTSGASLPLSFHIAFERLKDLTSKDDARAMASTTMEDVRIAARDIERQLELRRSLRGFRRIEPFLAGIEQYSKIVEVVCNGTPYLPYIWVSLRTSLSYGFS